MRGGGWDGRSSLSCFTRSFCSAFSSVWRLRISMRPSVVGKWTSSIWMAASLSSTALGVRAGRQRLELGAQRDVKAIGQEGDEDVRFDAVLELVVDRAELQIVLEIFECGLDLDELDIELPQMGRLSVAQIGAQQIATLAPARLAQLVAIEREAESG